jgi:hypothetical protein
MANNRRQRLAELREVDDEFERRRTQLSMEIEWLKAVVCEVAEVRGQMNRATTALRQRIFELEHKLTTRVRELEAERDAAWAPRLCIDCGSDVTAQQFMVYDEVWASAGLDDGWICVDCLEAALGRPLTGADFPSVPCNRPWTGEPAKLTQLKQDVPFDHDD